MRWTLKSSGSKNTSYAYPSPARCSCPERSLTTFGSFLPLLIFGSCRTSAVNQQNPPRNLGIRMVDLSSQYLWSEWQQGSIQGLIEGGWVLCSIGNMSSWMMEARRRRIHRGGRVGHDWRKIYGMGGRLVWAWRYDIVNPVASGRTWIDPRLEYVKMYFACEWYPRETRAKSLKKVSKAALEVRSWAKRLIVGVLEG